MANLKQYIKTSFQDYGLPSDGKGVDQHTVREDINYLYQKVKDFSRDVTQWDLYKITQVITDQEKLQAQVNSLPPYSSAIIAGRFVGDDGNVYSQGDLIYKKLDGTTQHIAAERGGVFRPSTITKDGNNYTILFQYLSKEPSEDAVDQVSGNSGTWKSTDTNKQKIEFQNLITQAPNNIYGIVKTGTDLSSGITFTKEDAFPIIKLYDQYNEEVYVDFTLSDSNGSYTINSLPTIVAKVVIK